MPEYLVEIKEMSVQKSYGVGVGAEVALLFLNNGPRVDQNIEWTADIFIFAVRPHEGGDADLDHHELFYPYLVLAVLVLISVILVRLILNNNF